MLNQYSSIVPVKEKKAAESRILPLLSTTLLLTNRMVVIQNLKMLQNKNSAFRVCKQTKKGVFLSRVAAIFVIINNLMLRWERRFVYEKQYSVQSSEKNFSHTLEKCLKRNIYECSCN